MVCLKIIAIRAIPDDGRRRVPMSEANCTARHRSVREGPWSTVARSGLRLMERYRLDFSLSPIPASGGI